MERPFAYLALSQVGAILFGILFSATGVRIWTRTFPEWGMAKYPAIVGRADWFAHYGILLLIPSGAWLVLSLLVSQGKLALPIEDKWLLISGVGLLAIFLWAGIGTGMYSILVMFN